MRNEAKDEKLGQDIFDICFEAVSERKDVASIWPKIRITLTKYFATTPLPNDLEQAAHTYAHDWVWPVKGVLWGVQETQQNNAMYELLKETFTAGHQHALSTLPDLIKKVLERAAENARAYNTVPRAYSDAAVHKQSILDTKFDDLINLKK